MANKKYFTDESLATFVDETKSYLDSHAGNTTVHITSTERTNWNAAKTHADSPHAPSNAEPNQNAFSNIAVSGQTTVAADAKQDTVTFTGSNVSITTDATNDKVTFTVADGSTSAKGVIQLTDSTSSTSTTTAATPSSVKSAYDLANTAKTNAATAQAKADSAYSLAEGKVDSLSDLGVTATAAELNYVTNVTSDIQSQLDGKAASGHTHNYAGSSSAGGAATSANKVNKSLTVQLNGGTTEGTNKFTFDGSTAKSVNITASAIGASASGHTHDDRYYTESEVDAKLSGKAPTSHASNATTYGIGTGSNYGHVKLSDAIDSTSAASSGIAASPAAVKSAYDKANHSHPYLPLAGGTMTGTLTVNGGDKAGGSKIALETGKGQITNSSTGTLFGYTSDTELAVGHSSVSLVLRGSGGKPTYNGKELDFASGYLSTHPEYSSMKLIPFIHNDLAFLDKKGGSIKYYTTTSTSYTAASLAEGSLTINNSANMFDGSPSYATLTANTTYTAVIDLSLHKTFQYSNQFYIDFGSANWRAKNIEIYVMNSVTETAYVKKGGVTGLASGNWLLSISHTSKNSSGNTVQGFDRIRIVLSSFNNAANRRIAQIGLVNYGSAGVTETFISRGGCSGIHGSLSPNKDGSYDLGTSSKRWKNVYADTLNGTTIPDSPKFTDTTYSNFVKSGSGAKAGLVPAPSTTAGTTKYLREDGTWATPPDNNTVYTHPTYTARTGKPTANQTPAFGGTATVSQITSDGTGHVTGATDRTITIPSTLSNGTGTAGLIKTTSTVTSNSGYTACPVISGVPYYKNTTYTALKNPNALTIQGNGTTLTNGTYDGSAAKTVNITPSSIGAFSSSGGTITGSATITGDLTVNGIKISGYDYMGEQTVASRVLTVSPADSHYITYITPESIVKQGVADGISTSGSIVCNRVYIPNGHGIRGMNKDVTSASLETSQAMVWVDVNNRVIVGNSDNEGRTEIMSPGYLYFLMGGSTDVSTKYCVGFVTSSGDYTYFKPGADAAVYLGSSSYKWKQLYATTTTIATSDRNLKKNIEDIDDRYIELFDLVRPVSYQLLSGDRLHTGFIAQEVEEAMEKVGLTAEELGFFCKDIKMVEDTENEEFVPELDEDGNPVYIYALRYEEYIAIMAEKVRRLEAKYDNRLNQLELELAELKANLN